MNYEQLIDQYGLPASPENREVLLTYLSTEMEKEKQGTLEDADIIRCILVQLFSIGDVEDSINIWEAKVASFDLMCGMDIQFICGAGIQATKKYLAEHDSNISKNALEHLNKCLEAGDFENWTPEVTINTYKSYFGIN